MISTLPIVNNTKCNKLQNGECLILRKLSGSPIDCRVSSVDCKMCSQSTPKQNTNKFTVCKTLQRIKLGGLFELEKHARLATAVKCAIGPGTYLHNEIGIFSNSKCGCEHKAAIMNEWGPMECMNNLDLIMEWLREASLLVTIAPVRDGLRNAVLRAISRSEREYRYYNLLFVLGL